MRLDRLWQHWLGIAFPERGPALLRLAWSLLLMPVTLLLVLVLVCQPIWEDWRS